MHFNRILNPSLRKCASQHIPTRVYGNMHNSNKLYVMKQSNYMASCRKRNSSSRKKGSTPMNSADWHGERTQVFTASSRKS